MEVYPFRIPRSAYGLFNERLIPTLVDIEPDVDILFVLDFHTHTEVDGRECDVGHKSVVLEDTDYLVIRDV